VLTTFFHESRRCDEPYFQKPFYAKATGEIPPNLRIAGMGTDYTALIEIHYSL